MRKATPAGQGVSRGMERRLIDPASIPLEMRVPPGATRLTALLTRCRLHFGDSNYFQTRRTPGTPLPQGERGAGERVVAR